jgi:ADP-ribose pyrophosphatase YjhB (NUDIX family)
MQRLPLRLISAYWRLTRGATLGAQGVIIDGEDRILLVRHGYRDGWHFPGGGIEWRETAEAALAREIEEETGVRVTGRPMLHGLFANVTTLPSDHIALFIVRNWERPRIPPPNHEILESRFFARGDLPAGVNGGARRRLAEIFEGAAVDAYW